MNITSDLMHFRFADVVLGDEDQLCFVRHNQDQKPTFKSSRIALKSWNIFPQIDLKLIHLCILNFTMLFVRTYIFKKRNRPNLPSYHNNNINIYSI